MGSSTEGMKPGRAEEYPYSPDFALATSAATAVCVHATVQVVAAETEAFETAVAAERAVLVLNDDVPFIAQFIQPAE